MNPKFRFVYLIGGFIGLVLLVYQVVDNLQNISSGMVLLITVPDITLFFLAYKTYPQEDNVKSKIRPY